MRASCFPVLPAGYDAQVAWGFHDPTGRFHYEFNRVYRSHDPVDERGATCRIDEDRCFWNVTWSTSGVGGDDRVLGRSLSYAEARELPGSHLSFERYSSLLGMHDRLGDLLHVGDIAS